LPTPPYVKSAFIHPVGLYLSVLFNRPTSRFGHEVGSTFQCSDLLRFWKAPEDGGETEAARGPEYFMYVKGDDELGGIPCYFTDDETLRADIDYGSTILPGDIVSVREDKLTPTGAGKWGNFSYADGSASYAINTWIPPGSGTDPGWSLVGNGIPRPRPVLQSQRVAGKCDAVVLDATRSTGSLGRDYTVIRWELVGSGFVDESGGEEGEGSDNVAETARITALLDQANMEKNPTLTIPPSLLLPGKWYTFGLGLGNYLGGTSWPSSSSSPSGDSDSLDGRWTVRKTNGRNSWVVIEGWGGAGGGEGDVDEGQDDGTTGGGGGQREGQGFGVRNVFRSQGTVVFTATTGFGTKCEDEDGVDQADFYDEENVMLATVWNLTDVTSPSSRVHVSIPVRSDNNDQNTVYIPPSILLPRHKYILTVSTVPSFTNGTSPKAGIEPASESVYIDVAPSPLVVSLNGGDRTVAKGATLQLTSWGTYDPDEDPDSSSSEPDGERKLLYQWSTGSTEPTATIDTSSLPLGLFIVNLTCTSLPTGKSTTSSTTIQVIEYVLNTTDGSSPDEGDGSGTGTGLPTTIPYTSIPDRMKLPSNVKPSPGNILKIWSDRLITGSFLPESVSTSWSSVQPSFLPPGALTTPPNGLVVGIRTDKLPNYLSSHTFRITTTTTILPGPSSGGSDDANVLTSYADLHVSVNLPPRSGGFAVMPREGEGGEGGMKFLLKSWMWVDEDLPLEYDFGFIVGGSREEEIEDGEGEGVRAGLGRDRGDVPVQGGKGMSWIRTPLPPGIHGVYVIVRDSLNSQTRAEDISINVTAPFNSETTLLSDPYTEGFDHAKRKSDGLGMLFSLSLSSKSSTTSLSSPSTGDGGGDGNGNGDGNDDGNDDGHTFNTTGTPMDTISRMSLVSHSSECMDHSSRLTLPMVANSMLQLSGSCQGDDSCRTLAGEVLRDAVKRAVAPADADGDGESFGEDSNDAKDEIMIGRGGAHLIGISVSNLQGDRTVDSPLIMESAVTAIETIAGARLEGWVSGMDNMEMDFENVKVFGNAFAKDTNRTVGFKVTGWSRGEGEEGVGKVQLGGQRESEGDSRVAVSVWKRSKGESFQDLYGARNSTHSSLDTTKLLSVPISDAVSVSIWTDGSGLPTDPLTLQIPIDGNLTIDANGTDGADGVIFIEPLTGLRVLCALSLVDPPVPAKDSEDFPRVPPPFDLSTCSVTSVDLQGGFARCLCPPDSLTLGPGSIRRRLSNEGDGSYFHEITHAFLRASVVLSTPATEEHFTENIIVVSILAAIYGLYLFVVIKAIIQDKFNAYQRHKVLVRSEFVGRAIRAMRENFVRLELSHKSSVLESTAKGNRDGKGVDRISSTSVSSGVRLSFESFALSRGLDAFSNVKKLAARGKLNERLLSKGSDLASFDEADDEHILDFLGTSNRISLEKESNNVGSADTVGNLNANSQDADSLNGNYDSSVASPRSVDDISVGIDTVFGEGGGIGGASSSTFGGSGGSGGSDDSDFNSPQRAEQAAFEILEQKLYRMKNKKMNQFWKGVRKEHEVMVVLNRKRKSQPSLRGSVAFSGGGGVNNNIDSNSSPNFASFRRALPEANETLTSPTDIASDTDVSGNQIKLLENDMNTDEAEEFISTAHHATVLLCQLLSFLAIAVFFFEEDESLFRQQRWDQFSNASKSEVMSILMENLYEGFFQVLLTAPITFFLLRLFRQLDKAGTARELFEIRVATDRAKLLHGISQENPVDLRRSIHEVEGLLRIIGTKGKRKQDRMVVKYTLKLLRDQLGRVKSKQLQQDEIVLIERLDRSRNKREAKIVLARHKQQIRRRQEVEDILVKLCR